MLIDFGEANETLKADRIEVGTPGYMAPEVLTDGDCTSASDVYSAGVTLIEIWHGGLWAGAETRGEGSEGMRREIMDVSAVFFRLGRAFSQLITSWRFGLSGAAGGRVC